MARSLLRQDTQIHNSEAYDDTVAAGATLESAAVTLEDDLNALRSQVHRILDATAGGNWYDAIATVNSKTRSILQLNTDLDTLEEKKLLGRSAVLTDITVPNTQNWVILSVAGSEAPSAVAAVALTQTGAVVAQSALSAGAFDVHELVEVAGPNALQPKNLALVRDDTTGDPILSDGRQVYALLQYESTGVDGGSFDDVSGGNRVKLSFVRPNATFDDLEAVPVADIQNQGINYSYVIRYTLSSVPEDAFLGGQFVDQSASVDVNLQNAIDNQGATAVTQTNSTNIDLANTNAWNWRDAASANLFSITGDSGGSASDVTVSSDVDTYNNNALVATFDQGITVDNGGTAIDIGVTSAGTIGTSGANDLTILGAQELFLDDGNRSGSTWATGGIKLAETTAEWDAFEVAFGGEVSLLNAITAAAASGGSVSKTVAAATSNVAADLDVGGPSSAGNLDADLGDYSSVTFLTDVDVYLNGQLLRNGADASANNDVYPGTSPADGELRFEFPIRGTGANPDVITMFVRS
jgi:hypothetical protein